MMHQSLKKSNHMCKIKSEVRRHHIYKLATNWFWSWHVLQHVEKRLSWWL